MESGHEYSNMFRDNGTSYWNESVENSDDTQELPYENSNCPSGSKLMILFNFPDFVIESLFYTSTDKIMISKVLPFIITLGFLTNLTFLWTLFRIREMRTITNFYLANLAFADLSFIVTTGVNVFYSFIWSSDFDRFVPWKSAPACALINGFTYVTFFGSLCLITLVSIERFLAICFPFKHRVMNDKPRTIKIVIGAWLTAVLLSALVAPAWGKHETHCVVWPEKYQQRLPMVINFCLYVKEEFVDIASICQFIPFFVALCLNTVLYGLIIARLSQRNVNDEQSQRQNQAQKVRNSGALMLVVNGIAFFFCLAPYQFFQMYYFVMRQEGRPFLSRDQALILGWVGRVSTALNSAVNPLIYSATNARYRRAFLSAVGCFSCRNVDVDKKGSASTVPTTSSSQKDLHM